MIMRKASRFNHVIGKQLIDSHLHGILTKEGEEKRDAPAVEAANAVFPSNLYEGIRNG